MITWTIGSGGLLGGAISRQSDSAFTGSAIPWGTATAGPEAWAPEVRRFRETAGADAWAIIWAAGAATVSSTTADAAPELSSLNALLHCLRGESPSGPGAFFLTSSAGGVYAGSTRPPFDDTTVPAALSPYGELKLQQESAARDLLAGTCPVVIGRMSNLYGPGQNLAKVQGLISRLAIAAATQQPLNIFVSLDTIRDYIFVDDAAAIAQHWIADAVHEQPVAATVRIIASGEPVTVGQLITTMRLVTKRRIPTALGSHPSARNQVLDLRLVPSDAEALEGLSSTPLPVGVKCVYLDILQRLQEDPLTGSR